MEKKFNISRRHLIGGSLAGGAMLFTGAASAACPDKIKWDEEHDVVVIGSGFAGLAAAIEAKKAGADVIVLEKMPTFGGNSIINGGIMTATGCPQQKMNGVEDSPELLAEDILKAGLWLNDPKKVKVMAEHAKSNYDWCVEEIGVKFIPDAIAHLGGHSVPRSVTTTNGSGSGILLPELEYAKKLGIPLLNKVYVERFIRGEDGRLEGLMVREKYRFPNADSGKVKYIRAKKGVVACYGGFAHDQKFRKYQDPKLDESFDSTNQPGATSELWRETSRIGALQVQNDWIQSGPWGNPREKGFGIAWSYNLHVAEFGLWVNSDGNRFVNELANRKIRADAIMRENNSGRRCWAIVNEQFIIPMKEQRPGEVEKMLERNLIEKYDTLDDVAKASGISPDGLKAQFAKFNGYILDKKDPDWNRYINVTLVPMEKGPWYVGELTPKVHHCMGGLYTDDYGRVIDIETDKPIPGFYAAGESTGAVHGAVRLGSVAILDCLVFGRIAGQAAAKGV